MKKLKPNDYFHSGFLMVGWGRMDQEELDLSGANASEIHTEAIIKE